MAGDRVKGEGFVYPISVQLDVLAERVREAFEEEFKQEPPDDERRREVGEAFVEAHVALKQLGLPAEVTEALSLPKQLMAEEGE